MITAALVFSYALTTNQPLYLLEQGPPFRDLGVRLELTKPLGYDIKLNIDPYIWKSKDMNAVGSGGLILRLSRKFKHITLSVFHRSEHNFDRVSKGGFMNINMVEVRYNFK